MTLLAEEERHVLRAAARSALSEHDWLAAARDALDGAVRHDHWPIAVAAGWPGLLTSEAQGGVGLGAAEALLVMRELGRELAGVPLLGHLLATALIGASASPADGLAIGDRRAAWLPARPLAGGVVAADAAVPLRVDGRERVTGSARWVPDAPGAAVLVASAVGAHERLCTVLVAVAAAEVEEVVGYDASRRLGHVRLHEADATVLHAPRDAVETTWALAQALLGAESLGAAERLLELSVEHARSRFAFGRAIGSFQAIKHQLVEVLRRIDSARALAGRAGAALAAGDADGYAVACALRFSAGTALDLASRNAIAVHGGMGATWEHPAALYVRRAQVARRLLGGHGAAATEVGRRLLAKAV